MLDEAQRFLEEMRKTLADVEAHLAHEEREAAGEDPVAGRARSRPPTPAAMILAAESWGETAFRTSIPRN